MFGVIFSPTCLRASNLFVLSIYSINGPLKNSQSGCNAILAKSSSLKVGTIPLSTNASLISSFVALIASLFSNQEEIGAFLKYLARICFFTSLEPISKEPGLPVLNVLIK